MRPIWVNLLRKSRAFLTVERTWCFVGGSELQPSYRAGAGRKSAETTFGSRKASCQEEEQETRR